jgi:quercetin dioxygenase-like cupin family protein
MTARSIRVVHPTDQAKVIFGAGDEYRYLATGDETDGGYFLVEAVVPPGGGPPFHIQTREEEAFYVLEGQLSFYGVDGETVAGPGTYLNIPKGAKHRFRNNGSTTARMLFFFTPAGIEGLFDKFSEMEEPAGGMAAIIESLNVLGEKYGVEYLGE